jgi:hypothetical protein
LKLLFDRDSLQFQKILFLVFQTRRVQSLYEFGVL